MVDFYVCIPEHRKYSGHLANGTDLVADDLLTGRSCSTWRGQRLDTVIKTLTHAYQTMSCGSVILTASSVCVLCVCFNL